MRRDYASMVTIGEIDDPRFPLYWTSDPKVITGFDFVDLTSGEQEMV